MRIGTQQQSIFSCYLGRIVCELGRSNSLFFMLFRTDSMRIGTQQQSIFLCYLGRIVCELGRSNSLFLNVI